MARRYREIFLSPVEAARGAAREILTPGGRVVLNIPKGARDGLVLRLRGAGKRRLLGGRGDLYARLWILNSLLEPPRPGAVDESLLEDIDFVLRYVSRGVEGAVGGTGAARRLDLPRLYTDYLRHGDLASFQRSLADSVGEEPVAVEFSDWLEVPGMLRLSQGAPRLGVPEHPAPRRIYVASALAGDPLAVGAVLAHESAHAFLFRRGYYDALNPRETTGEGPRQLDRRDEELTDLAVFGLGWGALTLNALRYRDGGWWALGYLNAETIRLAAWRAARLLADPSDRSRP